VGRQYSASSGKKTVRPGGHQQEEKGVLSLKTFGSKRRAGAPGYQSPQSAEPPIIGSQTNGGGKRIKKSALLLAEKGRKRTNVT